MTFLIKNNIRYFQIILTVGLRGGAAFILFFLYSTVSRNYSQAISGEFFYFHTLITINSLFLLFGLQPLIVRECARFENSLNARNIRAIFSHFFDAFKFTGPICFFVTVILLYFSQLDVYYTIWVFLASLFTSFIIIFSSSYQALQKFNIAIFFSNFLVPFLLVVILFSFKEITIHPIYLFMGATVGTVAVFSLLVLKQHEEDGEIVRGFSNSERWNFLSINLSTLIFNWGGVLIVGIFLGSEEVYQIGVAQRVGAVIAFSLFLSNSILAPRVSKLFCKGKILDLMNLTKSVNRVLIFIGVVTLIVIFYDKRFLSFFFDEQVFIYIDVIKVVCVAHFINVIFGNCTTLLSMTGGEKKLNLAMMSAAISNVLFTIPLTYFYGVIGTGIAFLVSMALMNVLCLFFVKEHLGFWLLGGIAFKCKVHDD